jgi:hypothetical protein
MKTQTFASIALLALAITVYAYGRSPRGDAPSTSTPPPSPTAMTPPPSRSRPPTTPNLAVPLTIYSTSGSTVSDVPVAYEQPFAPGDLPRGYHAVVYSGATALVTQQDGCSSWTADLSCKTAQLSFVAPRLTRASSAVYTIGVAAGAPSTAASISTAQATGNTNICVKTSDLTQANGTPESMGTYSLCLNWIVTHCAQFNSSTGYGKKPNCGWEYYSKGPVKIGIHAWQFLRRESDNAIHKWVRGDLWVDMRGSGTTPCPCSVSYWMGEPNQFGPIGTIGATTETAYVFSTTLYNGTNVLAYQGGTKDSRTATIPNAKFNATTNTINMTGTWLANSAGIFPVKLTCATSCPTGLTAGHIYWIGSTNTVTDFKLYEHQCDMSTSVGGCNTPAIDFNSQGSGTLTLAAYVFTNPYTGFLGLDTDANRFWISAAGSVMPAPPTLIGHDFSYLTQKTKATPPYITALNNKLRTYASGGQDSISDYYPGSFFFAWDMNQTGDGPGDERIAYINHTGAYSLFNPGDAGAAKKSRVMAAGFSRIDMYNIDERSGLPMVYNNGPAKNGVTYAGMGPVNPGVRTWYFLGGSLMHPYATTYDHDGFYWRYAVRLDGSHLPAPWQAPMLKSGDPEWLFQGQSESNANIGQGFNTYVVIGRTNYYRPFASNEQTRGIGWSIRALAQASHFTRDTDPAKPYFRDVLADNGSYLHLDSTTVLDRRAQTLGLLTVDVSNNQYQPWTQDHLWSATSMEEWRGENSTFASFNAYFKKAVIYRMDAASSLSGCLWAGPSRQLYPYSNDKAGDFAHIYQTWNEVYIHQAAISGAANSGWNSTNGGMSPTWKGCPSSGIYADVGGSSAEQPSGLVSFAAASAAWASLNGVARASSIYDSIRAIQYHATCYQCSVPMSFTDYRGGGGLILSVPEFAIGPLGATK